METNFENYIMTEAGEDLFEKVRRVDNVLRSGVLTGQEGLGLQSLGKTAPILNVKKRSGEVDEMIMLGSNSYLNLGTHPKVLEASKKALEKYGNGMGAVVFIKQFFHW